jgi:hypothetical protein
MTANLWRGRIWSALCTLCLLLVVASCTGGGTEEEQLPGTEPFIFGLSKSSVNAGETLSIIGSNFGLVQGEGTVTINGVPLTVNVWGDNQIDVTVPGGTSSGVIVVTQNGRSSQSGQQAQLFVGTVPSVTPVIISISPEAARAGQDEISIVGTGFGAAGGSNAVLFSNGAGGTVPGVVVNNNATGNPQWTATNIRVLVPAGARSGAVYVSTSNGPSNSFPLDVLPAQINLDNTQITDVSPLGGPVGTQLVISGQDFGGFQGNSRAFIQSGTQTRELIVSEWTSNSITATIPLGATTGTLHLIVSGKDITFGTPIIVALLPDITAVAPSEVRIGKSLKVLGKHFGDSAGSLQIGQTTFTAAQITTWSDNEITIAKLPAVQLPKPEDNHLNVVVTSSQGLASPPFEVQLVSDLRGTVTVSPKTGIANVTDFVFTVNAAGNDDSVFRYTLYPDATNPSLTKVSEPDGQNSADPQIHYKYTAGNTYNTKVKIEDVTTGDFITLGTPDTPTIKVGGPSDVVIVDFGPVDFASGSNLRENDYTAVNIASVPPPVFVYNDLLFAPSNAAPYDMWFTTGVDNNFQVGTNSTQWTRNASDFLYGLTGTGKTRPYGYRRASGVGKMRIHGYNFGSTVGKIWLNTTGPNAGVAVTNITAWNVKSDGVTQAGATEDGYIDFTLPNTAASLSGHFVVQNAAATPAFGVSADPLVVSASFLSAATTSPSLTDNSSPTTIVQGYDFTAPVIPGITGAQTRMFWVVWATYDDPFTATVGDIVGPNKVLCINPFPVTVVNGGQITFDFQAAFGVSPSLANVEVSDGGSPPTYKIAQNATLTAAGGGSTYSVFLWTGVLPNNGTITGQVLANSGVMSELKDVKVLP